jgi:hypothetical protein
MIPNEREHSDLSGRDAPPRAQSRPGGIGPAFQIKTLPKEFGAN